MVERPEDWEEVTWKPTAVLDGDLVMYLRAARFVHLIDTRDGLVLLVSLNREHFTKIP